MREKTTTETNNENRTGTGEVAQWLRVPAALSEDMSSVPSTHVKLWILPVILAPADPASFTDIHSHLLTDIIIYT